MQGDSIRESRQPQYKQACLPERFIALPELQQVLQLNWLWRTKILLDTISTTLRMSEARQGGIWANLMVSRRRAHFGLPLQECKWCFNTSGTKQK